MLIFESHAHYDDEAFDEDRDTLLGQMPGQGIGCIVNAGSSLSSLSKIAELMETWPFLYGAMGIHPDDVGELNEESFAWIRKMCRRDKTVAVGEIGLDYYWDHESHDIQKEWFCRQIQLAREEKLPFIVHSRDAAKDTLELLRSEQKGDLRGVIHCFSYGPEMAREYLDMGFYIGIGGVVTFKNGRKLKEVVAYTPLERILLETDCPYLAPEPYRGKRNCSLYIPYIAEMIADIKEIEPEQVIEQTYKNGMALFDKIPKH